MRHEALSAASVAAAALVVALASPSRAARAEINDLKHFKLGLSYQIVSAGFELEPQVGNAGKLVYRPSQSNYAGVVLGYRWLSGTVSFAVPANSDIRHLEGISRYRDYRLSYYTSRFGGEAAYTRYLGYLIDNSDDLSEAARGGTTYYKIPDLETLGYGINLFFATSKDGYSLAAAMDQSEIQEKSDGSWILAGTWRHQTLTSNSPLIPTEKQEGFGADRLIRKADTKAFAGGAGYGYTAIRSRWFASVLGALTAGYQSTKYSTPEVIDRFRASFQANLHLRIGLGINGRTGFVTTNFYFDRFGQETESLKVGNSLYGVTFAGGVRF
jgi:hypothetical protein